MTDRISVAAAGLGLLLLVSMLIRCVIAAQLPAAPAAVAVAAAQVRR